MFSVKNDVNLPITELFGNYVGTLVELQGVPHLLYLYLWLTPLTTQDTVSNTPSPHPAYNLYSDDTISVTSRCDKVNELPDTIVQIELENAHLNLSQKVAWQPITLTWETDKVEVGYQ